MNKKPVFIRSIYCACVCIFLDYAIVVERSSEITFITWSIFSHSGCSHSVSVITKFFVIAQCIINPFHKMGYLLSKIPIHLEVCRCNKVAYTRVMSSVCYFTLQLKWYSAVHKVKTVEFREQNFHNTVNSCQPTLNVYILVATSYIYGYTRRYRHKEQYNNIHGATVYN